MISFLVMLVEVTTLYTKKGGHCFFVLKNDANPVTMRFQVKRKVVKLDTTHIYRGGNLDGSRRKKSGKKTY